MNKISYHYSGIGYDVHRLVKGRRLILGGVEIEHAFGLQGHSDADVLTHAVCDALLGAAGLGDIGDFFPNDDPSFKNISSLILLEQVYDIITAEGFKVVNVDAVLLAEDPKIGPYKNEMKENYARCLKMPFAGINIKATTSEGLGFVGRKEGMAAWASASLVNRQQRIDL